MDIRKINSRVVENIKRIIKEKGLKKTAVAKKANIKTYEFSDMLNGRRVIKVTDIENIMKALDVDANELFMSLPDKKAESV